MNRRGWFEALLALILLANLLLLLVIVFQLDTREQRMIQQSAQFRELAESTDRVRAELRKLTDAIGSGDLAALGGGATRPGSRTDRAWLHPEVPNYLETETFPLTAPDAQMGGRLTLWWGPSDPKGFNGLVENAADLSMLSSLTESSLARRMSWDDPDRWTGDLAERVEITDDDQEFTFYLREGVKWHRPTGVDLGDPRFAWLDVDHEVTAHDIAFALRVIKDPQVQNGFLKNYYEDLESWEVIDDHTIVVRWSKRVYGALSATLGLGPMPEFLYAHDENGTRFPDETLGVNLNQHWYNNKGIVGSGPYRMVEYAPGERLRIERNEDYYGVLPAIREVVFEIFADDNLKFLKLKAHEHDFGALRPSEYRDFLKPWLLDPKLARPADNPFIGDAMSHEKFLTLSYFFIGWNADKPLFADKRVRHALTHAFDRQTIIDEVFEGLGRVPPGHMPAESPFNDPGIVPLEYDLVKSRAILAEAGWEDSNGDGLVDKDLDGDGEREPFEFTLLVYASSPEMDSMANLYKEALLKVGVRLTIDKAEWSLMQKRMDEKEFDAFTGGWGLSWDGDPFQIWHSSQADIPRGSNRVGFRNDEADEIIETLRVTFDLDERKKLFHRFHRILHEEQPYTLFYSRERVYVWWNDLQRVVFAKLRPHASPLPWWVDERG